MSSAPKLRLLRLLPLSVSFFASHLRKTRTKEQWSRLGSSLVTGQVLEGELRDAAMRYRASPQLEAARGIAYSLPALPKSGFVLFPIELLWIFASNIFTPQNYCNLANYYRYLIKHNLTTTLWLSNYLKVISSPKYSTSQTKF